MTSNCSSKQRTTIFASYAAPESKIHHRQCNRDARKQGNTIIDYNLQMQWRHASALISIFVVSVLAQQGSHHHRHHHQQPLQPLQQPLLDPCLMLAGCEPMPQPVVACRLLLTIFPAVMEAWQRIVGCSKNPHVENMRLRNSIVHQSL